MDTSCITQLHSKIFLILKPLDKWKLLDKPFTYLLVPTGLIIYFVSSGVFLILEGRYLLIKVQAIHPKWHLTGNESVITSLLIIIDTFMNIIHRHAQNSNQGNYGLQIM